MSITSPSPTCPQCEEPVTTPDELCEFCEDINLINHKADILFDILKYPND